MKFINDNLTKEDIRNTLKFMKAALELYEREYKNKLYVYELDKNNQFKFEIPSNFLHHLLGFDVYVTGTWLEYIGHHKANSYEWLFDFVKSGEFIEFLLFDRSEQPVVNFAKMLYKSMNFCDMSLREERAIIFSARYSKQNIGIIKGNKIISFKTAGYMEGNVKHVPRSLYIYDKSLKEYDPKSLKSFTVPNGLTIQKIKEKIILDDMYNPERRKEELGKIKTFRNIH